MRCGQYGESKRLGNDDDVANINILSNQKGVGLIEVLIAVLVLSIGFLGVAALQVASLNNNNSSMARSMATVYTYTILDAMRADRSAALGGSYNVAMPSTITSTSCVKSGSTFADNQLSSWRAQIQQNLGGEACGSVSCAAGTCTVVIQFNDSRATGGSMTQQVTTEVVL